MGSKADINREGARRTNGNPHPHARKELGWTQEELALKAAIGRSYVSGVERGERNVRLRFGHFGPEKRCDELSFRRSFAGGNNGGERWSRRANKGKRSDPMDDTH